jgi:Cu2+-exporting ATPase
MSEKNIYKVDGMSCAACASSVETILSSVKGVSNAVVNYANASVLIEFEPSKVSFNDLQTSLAPAGYRLIEEKYFSIEDEELKHFKHLKKIQINLIGSAILSTPVFIMGMFFHHYHELYGLMMLLSIPVLFWFGKEFFIKAWQLAKHFTSNMDTLVALGTGSAFIYSVANTLFSEFFISKGFMPQVYFESAVVIITFILLGRYLEKKAKHQTSSSIRKLLGLQVKTANLYNNGEVKEVPVEFIQPGDILLIKPGEKVPVDGVVKEGTSWIDESMISGESLPVEKQAGEKLYSATINQDGRIVMIAEKVGSETLLAHIIKMVKEAQGSKAPVQKLADKIASIFVPGVLLIALVSFTIWFLFGPSPQLVYAFKTLFAVLIIACPCALGLATPTAIMVSVGKCAQQGILIKDAQSIEKACEINVLAIDKTGTITTGKQRVEQVIPEISEIDPSELSVILSAEMLSEHPIAKAISTYLKSKGIEPLVINSFTNIPGKGIVFNYNKNGYTIGNNRLLEDYAIPIPHLFNQHKNSATTLVYVAKNNQLICSLAISDEIKDNTKNLVHQLKGLGISVHLLSGDNESIVSYVAKECGIMIYKSGCLPGDKAQYIKSLQEHGYNVAMAGDGINDTPALAQADVSFAMEHGTDVALENAQITLIKGDLSKIVTAIDYSKKTMVTIKQNLFWAFFYNIITIPVAAGILYPLWGYQLNPMLAGIIMAFSSVTVVANSLRLNKQLVINNG